MTQREIVFESAGARLWAFEMGEGVPVVFLHGGLADHRAALFRVGALARRCRLIAPDLRGSGRSVHSGALDWDLLADDIVALLDHERIECAVIGGVSMGSAVALRFALRHPERASALIVMSPVYPGEDRGLDEAAKSAMQRMGEVGARVATEGVGALRPLFESLPEPVRAKAIEMMLGFDAASVAATTRFLATNAQPMKSAEELSAIRIPVMIIRGNDPQHPANVADLYARYLNEAEIVEPTSMDLDDRLTKFCEDSMRASAAGCHVTQA